MLGGRPRTLLNNVDREELPLFPTSLEEREIEPPEHSIRQSRELDAFAERIVEELLLVPRKTLIDSLHLEEYAASLTCFEAVVHSSTAHAVLRDHLLDVVSVPTKSGQDWQDHALLRCVLVCQQEGGIPGQAGQEKFEGIVAAVTQSV